jgi:RND family efflux transporter MFP subunit
LKVRAAGIRLLRVAAGKRRPWLLTLLCLALLSSGCGKREPAALQEKKALLEQLRKRQADLDAAIRTLEAEVATARGDSAKAPPDSLTAAALKLVKAVTLVKQEFTHYIDLQGQVTSDNIINVTPRGGGGQVVAIYVKEGDMVTRGQRLLKLDDAVSRQNLLQVENQLALATDIYQRRKNLWEQDIGTEVQYLTDKNNMENLQKQYQIAREQWDNSNVYARTGGRVERVSVRVGELFTGAADHGITIVDPTRVKAVVDVPEKYLTQVRKGAPVVVQIPEISGQVNSTISVAGLVINPQTRGFTAEARIPPVTGLKAGLLAIVKVRDYQAKDVIVIPLPAVQTDEKGKFVFVATVGQGTARAHRRQITIGQVYGERVVAEQGLQAGELLITQGFQDLYDGQLIAVERQ